MALRQRPGCWRCCVFFYFCSVNPLTYTLSTVDWISHRKSLRRGNQSITRQPRSWSRKFGSSWHDSLRMANRTRHRTQVYHAQWFRTFYNASCLIANVYTHTWRQWQALALSRNYPKYISTIPFLLSSLMETSVSTTWNWEQMARFGFLSGMYPQWFEYASIMAYDGKDPPRGCSCLWIAMLLVFNTMHLRSFFGDPSFSA